MSSSTPTSATPSSSSLPSASQLSLKNVNIETAPGIELSQDQKTIVGSVLDLFQGHVSLKKLALWDENATFNDPLTTATGYKQFAAQWYGLQSIFGKIIRLDYRVTSAGNPIEMDLETKYVAKILGIEKVIKSKIVIETNPLGKIVKVQDEWNGHIPDGPIATFFRNINSVTVPVIVGVPKTDEEDAKRVPPANV